ncbi:hypothetical protein B8X02_10930 [Stenotrophomonas rhizophila]|nr:hypothetical protein B8X02_10930 [Stenotrophomonas rhizophila]
MLWRGKGMGRRMGLKTQHREGRTARHIGVVGLLLSTLLGAGCAQRPQCTYTLSTRDPHSGVSQHYWSKIEHGLAGKHGDPSRSIGVHLIGSSLIPTASQKDRTRVFYALQGPNEELLQARTCEGSITRCSAQIVDLALAECRKT